MSRKLTNIDFIEKAIKTHGEKYDYSITSYENTRTKVKIVCKIHGEFYQEPSAHLRGDGCSKCNGNNTKTTKEFISLSKNIHGNKYDYSMTEYKNIKTKIKIICLQHGEFIQTPANHLQGCGCPKCKESKGEKKIRLILEKNNINYIKEKIFKDCINEQPLRFDFFLPQKNLCIEYNGEQHYESVEYFGGNEMLELNIKRDFIKKNYCKSNNINLLTIKYDENINEKLQELLK